MTKTFRGGLTALALAAATSAQALPVAYEFSGTITTMQRLAASSFGSAQVGSAFQVRIVLDDTLVDRSSSNLFGNYGDTLDTKPSSFVSSISAVVTAGGLTRAISFDGGRDAAAHQLTVQDGSSIFYSGGRSVVAEGLQLTSEPASGRSASNNFYAYLWYRNEYAPGTPVSGAGGVLPSDALPSSLAGIGGTDSRHEFGWFWGPNSATGTSNFFAGNITSATVVTNAAANPAVTPWPGAGGSSTASPLLPADSWDNGDGGSSFLFDIDNTAPTRRWWLDPPVAVGYEYALDGTASGQRFTSVVVGTQAGDGLYTLSWSGVGGAGAGSVTLATGQLYTFAEGGVAAFTIDDIEPSAQLDPNNPAAFVTGVTFAQAGAADVLQTAIVGEYTPPVPEPASALLIAAGLAGLLGRRRRIAH